MLLLGTMPLATPQRAARQSSARAPQLEPHGEPSRVGRRAPRAASRQPPPCSAWDRKLRRQLEHARSSPGFRPPSCLRWKARSRRMAIGRRRDAHQRARRKLEQWRSKLGEQAVASQGFELTLWGAARSSRIGRRSRSASGTPPCWRRSVRCAYSPQLAAMLVRASTASFEAILSTSQRPQYEPALARGGSTGESLRGAPQPAALDRQPGRQAARGRRAHCCFSPTHP